MTVLTGATQIPTDDWSSDYGPFTRPVWLQVRKGWVVLNFDATAPTDITDGVRLYQADQVGPVEIPLPDGATDFGFRISDPGNSGAIVWYSQFPAAF